jgi:uncharacterized coiled-coil protein SlyX
MIKEQNDKIILAKYVKRTDRQGKQVEIELPALSQEVTSQSLQEKKAELEKRIAHYQSELDNLNNFMVEVQAIESRKEQEELLKVNQIEAKEKNE